jgi:galactokinase
LFEIGAPAMAAMMAAMLGGPGVLAARQAGAGFGGCMVALVQADETEAFAAHVSRQYEEKTGIKPRIFDVSAAAGAGPLNSQ